MKFTTAGITMICEGRKFKHLGVKGMKILNDNRHTIMHNYLTSINLDAEGWKKFAKLQQAVAVINDGKTMEITPWLLK